MSVSLSKVFSKNPGWYRGDFHAHTTCSDGTFSPKGLNELACKHGLDFLSITDHNAIHAYDDFDESLDHMVLPGIEITLLNGHFNVFGFEGITSLARELFHSIVDLPPEQRFRQYWDHEKIVNFMDEIKKAGLMIDLAHPLLWPWEWRDHDTQIAYFDCVELINDPTYRDNPAANPSTRRMWDAWLNAGHRITAVGGTDFHSLEPSDDPGRVSLLNLPLTYVYAQELSGRAILDGLRQRHVYVSIQPRIEFQADVDGRKFLMGDDLGMLQSPARLFARVEGCGRQADAHLVQNGKVVTKVPVVNDEAEIEWHVQPVDCKSNGWVRLDVLDPEGQMLAMSNPIFFGTHAAQKLSPYGRFLGGYIKPE